MSANATVGSSTSPREPPCFTINACNRCRRRKAKCDPGLPSCTPCQRIGAVCEYTDPRSKTAMPRTSILALEEELARLEADLRAQSLSSSSDNTHSPNGPNLIRLEPGEDAHFLGVSSGMHLARSVLESAQRNDASFQPGRRSGSGSSSDKDGGSSGTSNDHNSDQPNSAASTQPGSPQEMTEDTSQPSEHTKPTGPVLPSRETAISLIDIFLSQYEVQYPIVVGDDMAQIVIDCYGDKEGEEREYVSVDREKNAWNQFILNMVFAIALVVLSRENPESLSLAKSFSSAAMADFSTIMQRKSVRTLQCLLFLLLWSILDSSSAPIWYISGLCMRMCVDLGFHSETTIGVSAGGSSPPSPAEMDVKRRLFWVTYTFDRTLGTLLGRPFTLTDSMIDVRLPQHALSGPKRDQVLHWFRLQQLQSQIVYRLYSLRSNSNSGKEDTAGNSTDTTPDDTARWKADMAAQLRQWGGQSTSLADPQGHTLDWWEYWHQNAILLLHRPSPLKPQLDADEADTCCTAAQHMIQLSFTRLQRGSADFAWVDLHYQLMSGITLLFLVWKHSATRAKAKTGWTSFKNCLMQWTYVLDQLARQWDRISRTRDVLTRLVDTTIDIVEKELCNKLSASDVRVLRHAHASPQPHTQHPIHTGGPTPPQQQLSYERSTSYGTPSSDTAVNTSQSVGSNFINQAEGNIYAMQVSPSHSGQPISPQWITPTADHPLPLVAPFHQGNDYVPTQTDPVVQLLDQQAWHGLELYESFGAIPDNNMTMLDYFSTTPLGINEGGGGSILSDGAVGNMVQQNAHVQNNNQGQGATGSHDMVGVWPDSLTNSILNFQPNFHDLGDFGS
ncbi:hypothetical protein Sste5346_003362 [Sporothrix stenoceras]|uniref:Zn(2)-C6 fungal-type domain-containing protein n=1 Tax=Sporothrix stenoceras TaxID=5173 RepID=A0ABR3ZFY3_9PEZI